MARTTNIAAAARPIRRLLIANRGEIAVRVARTAREMGISPVAVHSDPDRDALHVAACDMAIGIGGNTPATSYLLGEAIIEAAIRSGSDAVHPGYGFLSENAGFAQAVMDAGLTWVGPDPETIEEMGDKIRAKKRMAAAGVPVLTDVVVSGEMDLREAVRDIPLPIIAKAAAGGGGKGMRLIRSLDELDDSVAACRREAKSSFGDDRVFLERFLPNPRHIEVQILGDRHGNVVHLFERECSIQRRHQKVLEETPSTFLDDALRATLCSAAVAAGQALDYVGVGTVEFVVGEDRSIAFLEVNTRLQVEHPITEAITGLDLVRQQILVAEGAPLIFAQQDIVRRGHAIEARLYAEDPASGYLPAAGALEVFEPADVAGVRWDIGVASGATVSPFYDPMVAKVIAHAETRAEASRRLSRALRLAHIHGPVNNRDLLVSILEHPAFLNGKTTTAFLDTHYPDDAARRHESSAELERDALAVAALAIEYEARAAHPIAPGWRNNRSQGEHVAFDVKGEATVEYFADGRGGFTFAGDGWKASAARMACDGARMTLVVDGRRLSARYSIIDLPQGREWEITLPTGHVRLTEKPRFALPEPAEAAGATLAPMHGMVSRVEVAVGQSVAKDQLLCIVEAMKMEHRILAPHSGEVVAVEVAAGQQVEARQILVVVSETTAESDK